MKALEFSRALVFSPHPDDAELILGGSIAKWASEGRDVVLCVVTNGAAGSNDPSMTRDSLIAVREQEQRRASALLGISHLSFLGYEDGLVDDSHELRRDMIREIRRHKPDLVAGPDPSTYYLDNWYINHPDHRKVGEAFLDAVSPGASTLPLYKSELYEQGFEPHGIALALLSPTAAPDYFVDIGDFVSTKIAALRQHTSQLSQFEDLDGLVMGIAGVLGVRSGQGFRYAEAFKAFFLADWASHSPAGRDAELDVSPA